MLRLFGIFCYGVIGLDMYRYKRNCDITKLLKQCKDLEIKDKKIYIKKNINNSHIIMYGVLWPITLPVHYIRCKLDDAIDDAIDNAIR